ncbi:MAG: peptidylprolyl isomerase [Candidatus Micrarchaeales archaeon]
MQPNKIMANQRNIWILIALIVGALVVVYLLVNSSSAQVVANGDTLQVYYTGRFTNGTVFDSNVGKQTFNFTVGANQLIMGFDRGVIGMKLNETRNVTVPPNEAYGEINQSLIVEVPLTAFGNQTVTAGMIVTRTSNGQRYQGTVLSTNAIDAVIDFNHPLAGKTLIFNIKVVGIKKKQ